MMKRAKTKIKLNNSGFTLLEVLIAVIILAVVCVPIFRAIITSAETNAKSKIKMRATNTAENLMEDFKTHDIEELVESYSKSASNTVIKPGDSVGGVASSKYIFDIADSTYYKEKLPDTYTVKVELDPLNYPNTNSLNLADLSTVSSKSSAILSMNKEFDKQVYALFEEKNTEMAKADSSVPNWDIPDFDKKLRREIRVDIEKTGTFKDEDEVEQDEVSVTVNITYILDDNKIVPDSYAEGYKAMTRKIFNNKTSKIPLKNIYVLYTPRYEAAANEGDIITVFNRDNVKANLYVVAQGASGTEWKDYNKNGKGLILNIFESVSTPITNDTEAALTLFTNLNEGPEYLKSDDSEQRPVTCHLNLARPSSYKEFKRGKSVTKHPFGDVKIAHALDSRDVDGRLLDASRVGDKIYDIKVEVREGGATLPTVVLTGTKTN